MEKINMQNTSDSVFLSRLNTGGNYLVDVYYKKINENTAIMLNVDNEGANIYNIDLEKYKEFIEKNQQHLREIFAEKVIKSEDVEWMFWITLEQVDGIEDIIKFECSVDHEDYDIEDSMKIRKSKCELIINY